MSKDTAIYIYHAPKFSIPIETLECHCCCLQIVTMKILYVSKNNFLTKNLNVDRDDQKGKRKCSNQTKRRERACNRFQIYCGGNCGYNAFNHKCSHVEISSSVCH